jgi:hypothetical protein
MRNLLALIGAVVVLFAGLGWYLGWYTFALEPSVNGKQRIQLDVDTDKLTGDVERFGKTIGSAVQRAKDDSSNGQPGEFVGPPLPPDMPTPRATTVAPLTPGQFSLPTRRN